MGSLQELLPLMEQQRDLLFNKLCEWAKLPNQRPLNPAQKLELQADHEKFKKAEEAVANLKRSTFATPVASPEPVSSRTAYTENADAARFTHATAAEIPSAHEFPNRIVETRAHVTRGDGIVAPLHGLPDVSPQLPLHIGRASITAKAAQPSNGSLFAPQHNIASQLVAQEHGHSQTGFGLLIPQQHNNPGSTSGGDAHLTRNVPSKRPYSSFISSNQVNNDEQANIEQPQPNQSKTFIPPILGFSNNRKNPWWFYKDMIYDSETGNYYKTPPCPHCPAKGTHRQGVFEPFKGFDGLAAHFGNKQDTHAKENLGTVFKKENLRQYLMTVDEVKAAMAKTEEHS